MEWRRCGRILQGGEHLVALEGLTDVHGTFRTDHIAPNTARKEGETEWIHQCPALTTTRANNNASVFRAVKYGGAHALDSFESLVDLESLADVLGSLTIDAILSKTEGERRAESVSTPRSMRLKGETES
jgi:hypothetical protein